MVGAQEIDWTRSLHGKDGRTHIKEVKQIMDYGMFLKDRVRAGGKDITLPLIVYYDTGRLYMQNARNKMQQKTRDLRELRDMWIVLILLPTISS